MLTVATVAALIVMSAVAPRLATADAWGHAVIVIVFVILLPLRMGAARKDSTRALRAVIIMAVVVFVVNVVEAALPLLRASATLSIPGIQARKVRHITKT